MIPLVSIIIPYYDKSDTIKRAIDSIIAQTYSNWEVILVDDFSKVPLLSLSDWDNYPIKLIRNEENLGPGPTRQRGMGLAKGQYLAFLDADDWWSESFLQKSLDVLQINKSAGASWVMSMVYNKDNSIAQRRYSDLPFTNIQETILQYARPWQTGSLLWRRDCAGEWGSLSTNQDYLFEFSSSLKCNSVIPVGEVLYYVDQRTGNHRSDLVQHEETVRNQFELHRYVYDNLRHILSPRSRMLLFHRIIRALLKVTENCQPETSLSYWKHTEQMYPITRMLARQPFCLKVIHYFLQRTPYRLYF